MPRKYAGPLQPGKRSAYVKGTRKRSSKKKTSKTPKTADKVLAKLNYRKPMVYAFVRETLPETRGFSTIDGGDSFAAIGYLNFDNLQFNQLVQSTAEFGSLFARYKVDKIETILTPMYQETIGSANTGIVNSVGLRITRVNTKWLNEPFEIQNTADEQLAVLAQLQAKTVRPYASKYSMKIITTHPRVSKRGVLDSTNTEIDTNQPMPWLNIKNQSDVPLKHNSIIFAERVDASAISSDWQYRVVHKVYFRCSQVG